MARRTRSNGAEDRPIYPRLLRIRAYKPGNAAALRGAPANRDKCWGCVAEREGFEPSIRFWRILTFQASAFDHSATAPQSSIVRREPPYVNRATINPLWKRAA